MERQEAGSAKGCDPDSIHNNARSPKAVAFGTGVSQASLHTFLDQRSLELGHRGDDLKHEPARRRGQV